MKSVYKLLTLPLALMCLSASPNKQSVEFVSLGIIDDNPTAGTFKLCAYLNILVRNLDKSCTYTYHWIDEQGNVNDCGMNTIYNLTIRPNVMLTGCADLKVSELNLHSPVTFMCKAKVNNDEVYTITLPYNGKVKDDFTISEESNNKEFSTGYLKESHYPDPKQDYRYEDIFSVDHFEDLYVNELYYDLDISYLRFKYRNGLDDQLKGTFTFAFYDRYDLFPDFEVGEESMYRYIPLSLNQDEEGYYFTFAPTMYYDPLTHDCGLTKKDNWIATNHLMLPFKYAAELKFLPCYIELNVKGHTNFHIKGKFMMTYLKKYFGDCEDSEFCYEIHQNDEVNIREKIIEVVI